MKLSKQRKAYACILGLVGAAWVGDRLFLSGGPDQASASGGLTVGIAPVAGQAPQLAVRETPARVEPSLAQRLAGLRVVQEGPPTPDDAFGVPEDWRRAPGVEAEAPPEFDTLAFAATHRLTGVLIGPEPSRSAAVVNGGSLLRVGQQVDGMTLRQVTTESAIFERDGVQVRLRIDHTGGKGAAGSENGGGGARSR